MQKKLLGMAVAAALAVPTAVLAQSAVTISGTFKVGVDRQSVGDKNPARTGKSSEIRVVDNSSQIHFNVTEDHGGGTDNASGNTWVGIRGAGFGTLTLGRHDLHYGKQPDDVPVKGALMASSVSLMDFAGGGKVAVANATRTPNVIRWDSPAWGGFNVTAAYSTNPIGGPAESEMASGTSGSGWNINPSFTAANFQVGLSLWDAKADAPGATTEQESQVVYGFMRFGAIKVGAAFHRAELTNQTTGAKASDRDAFTIPVSFTAGRNTFAAHFTQAGEDDVIGGGSKARMIALMYAMDFSKRTSLSFTAAQITNESAAAYDFFTQAAFGGAAAVSQAGEDPRMFAVTLRHTF
jgi:predicted porin